MKKIYNLNLNYYIAGACSIVTQSPPFLRAEVGSAVNLSCSIEQVNGFCFHVTWYKIVPSRPGSLVPLADHTARRNGTQAGPRDKQCNLTLGRVETQDSAIYYCAYSKNVMIYTGDGSRLLVTERSPAPASMVLLSQSDSDSSASAALVCLLYGPVSAQTRLYWNISGRVDLGLSDSGSLNSSESDGSHSFFLRNQISVAADVWSRGAPCTCVAETEAGVRISRTFQKRNTDKAGNGSIRHRKERRGKLSCSEAQRDSTLAEQYMWKAGETSKLVSQLWERSTMPAYSLTNTDGRNED
ncbi:M1-specific T cell receptor beta chain-like [Acipenser oxyrinchus oxyrinchus]|nr:M1-specific T cell receptor beta chain-like [Acipenser oxyrinchus oxyrinchus]